jgi:hypothetical protein
MPGKLDGVMVPLAKNLIADFGGPVPYTQVTETFDISTGKTTKTEVVSSQSVTPPEPYKTGRIDGDVIRMGDMKTLIADSGLGFVPSMGDNLLYSGVEWQIVAVDPVYSGQLTAMYELQLRR